MDRNAAPYFFLIFLILFNVIFAPSGFTEEDDSLLEATPDIREYAMNTVKPVLDSCVHKDKLSLLLKVSAILIDPEIGIGIHKINPNKFIVYDKLQKVRLGFLITGKLSSEQKEILKTWHVKFMQENPADVFFAPSADEIITTRAAFGCSHYARSFIAVVKTLGLVENPEELRYVVSCEADNYNQAFDSMDKEMTMNGHQFVLVYVASKWIAINTSKGDWIEMPEGFSPDILRPPNNIHLRFDSYPDVTLLLRKIGEDYDDDCRDNTLKALMNIYRSGDAQYSSFKWDRFERGEGNEG